MTESIRNRVYCAYHDYVMKCTWYNHDSDTERTHKAHFLGRLGIAYLECRCHECRFIPRTWCPESFETILTAYEENYPEEAVRLYGYADSDGRDGVDEQRFIDQSPCLMMDLFRRRYAEREAAEERK
jgi:hypothetical protein